MAVSIIALHSRYIFYCQYQRLAGVGPTHGILYFVTLTARLDTILHSGNDVSSASSIDEISLSGISFPLCIEGHTTQGFHKGATGIARPGWKNRVGTNKKIVCFVTVNRSRWMELNIERSMRRSFREKKKKKPLNSIKLVRGIRSSFDTRSLSSKTISFFSNR